METRHSHVISARAKRPFSGTGMRGRNLDFFTRATITDPPPCNDRIRHAFQYLSLTRWPTMTDKSRLTWRILLLAVAGPLVYTPFAYLMDAAFIHDWLTATRVYPAPAVAISPDKKYVARVVRLLENVRDNPFFDTEMIAITLSPVSIFPD